jgi:hypothetical protein
VQDIGGEGFGGCAKDDRLSLIRQPVIPGVHLTGGGGNGGDPSDPWTCNSRPGVDLDGGGCGRQLSLIRHMRLNVTTRAREAEHLGVQRQWYHPGIPYPSSFIPKISSFLLHMIKYRVICHFIVAHCNLYI